MSYQIAKIEEDEPFTPEFLDAINHNMIDAMASCSHLIPFIRLSHDHRKYMLQNYKTTFEMMEQLCVDTLSPLAEPTKEVYRGMAFLQKDPFSVYLDNNVINQIDGEYGAVDLGLAEYFMFFRLAGFENFNPDCEELFTVMMHMHNVYTVRNIASAAIDPSMEEVYITPQKLFIYDRKISYRQWNLKPYTHYDIHIIGTADL